MDIVSPFIKIIAGVVATCILLGGVFLLYYHAPFGFSPQTSPPSPPTTQPIEKLQKMDDTSPPAPLTTTSPLTINESPPPPIFQKMTATPQLTATNLTPIPLATIIIQPAGQTNPFATNETTPVTPSGQTVVPFQPGPVPLEITPSEN